MNVDLNRPISRNLDEPARIVGLSPLELASCAVFYSILSMVLKRVPFSALLSLVTAASLAAVILILNRTYPPYHGIFFIMHLFRPSVTPIMTTELTERSQ